MASLFTHAYTASACYLLFSGLRGNGSSWKFWSLAVVCAIVPDADAIFHAFGEEWGIPWGHPLGHRGVTHTLLFALLLGISVAALFYRDLTPGSRKWCRRRWMLAGFFALVTATHPLLDAMTGGGLGMMWFYPFDTERSFLPWRPIRTSPIGIGAFFTRRGMEVITTELFFIWLPVAVWVGLILYFRSLRGRERDPISRTGRA